MKSNVWLRMVSIDLHIALGNIQKNIDRLPDVAVNNQVQADPHDQRVGESVFRKASVGSYLYKLGTEILIRAQCWARQVSSLV